MSVEITLDRPATVRRLKRRGPRREFRSREPLQLPAFVAVKMAERAAAEMDRITSAAATVAASKVYGRRPDLDKVCATCREDGITGTRMAAQGLGRTFAYLRAPIKNKKGRAVKPALEVHWCGFHQREVTAVA